MPDDADDADDDHDRDDPVAAETTSSMKTLRPLLARIAAQWLTFPRLRQEMLNQGAPDPLIVDPTNMDVQNAVLALLDPGRPAGELERAYVALTRSLAGCPELDKAMLFEHMRQGGQDDGALQAMLEARDDVFTRWYDMIEGMSRVGLTLCQVYVHQQFKGTGFLVGDRFVLTAYHCIEALIAQGKPEKIGSDARLYFVFDDVVMPGKTRSVYRTEIAAARDWLVKYSPPDDGEKYALSPLDEINCDRLDFALIRLAEPAGAMAPKQQRSARRQWLELSDLAKPPQHQAQMLIAHYPGGADLRLSVGLFQDFAKESRRVRYRTPAIVGSSGAPCFTIEWKPYALHNAGYPKVPVNQGVPLKLIWDAIGGAAAFASASESSLLIPPVMPDGSPILGRLDIIQEVDAMLRGASATTVMAVSGAPGSGKRFTASLLRAMLIDRGHIAFMLDAEKFAADTPELFAGRLINEIRGRPADTPQPPSPDSRQRARWISRNLSEWVRSAVGTQAGPEDGRAAHAERTIWLLLVNCESVRFSAETHDLLVALLGDADADDAQNPVRFVLTGYDGDLAALPPERVWQGKLDLVSAGGVLPYMQHTLESLSVTEDAAVLRASATAWVQTAIHFQIRTIPLLAQGLIAWRRERAAAVAAAPERTEEAA